MVALKFQWDLDLFERCKLDVWVQRSHHVVGASALRHLERAFGKALEFNLVITPDEFSEFQELVRRKDLSENSTSLLDGVTGDMLSENAFMSLELEDERKALGLGRRTSNACLSGGGPSYAALSPLLAFHAPHSFPQDPPTYWYPGYGPYMYPIVTS
jgi:hypothetical protein